MIEHSFLTTILSYNPATGGFTWRKQQARCTVVGSTAGSVNKSGGYRRISILRKSYLEHRLAWFYMTGKWPAADIDHRDGNRTNNCWGNLRQATKSQNSGNRKAKAKFKGTTRACNGKWHAKIFFEGKLIYLGAFNTRKEAHEAYTAKAIELFGEFARAA